MTGADFKKVVHGALQAIGFVRDGKALTLRSKEVSLLANIEKGFGCQWYINIGLWLNGLEVRVPETVEKCHMYFRLERLIPEQRETILAAGALDDPAQSQALQRFLTLISSGFQGKLGSLCSEAVLKEGLAKGWLSGGLIRKEVRTYLAQ